MARRVARPRRVAVVTDSSACLPHGEAERAGVTVVPLHVVIDGVPGREGVDVHPADVARALGSRRYTVTTSRPAPAELAAVYREAFERGAEAVVSVHLSRAMSGTVASAAHAAGDAGGPVTVVDSGSTGMGLGFPVLAAAAAAEAGWNAAAVAAAARAVAERTTTLFSVDTLEHLRRGGRIGAAAALLGVTLAVRPILHVVDGAIVVREKVRTTQVALRRLEELAVAAATDGSAGWDVAVHHLGAAERAEALRGRLVDRVDELSRVVVSELGAAVGAHLGPGALGVVVAPRPA